MDLIRVAGAGQVLVMVQMRDITDRKKLNGSCKSIAKNSKSKSVSGPGRSRKRSNTWKTCLKTPMT